MYKYRLQKRGAFGFSRISGFCLCFVARLGGSTLQPGAAAGGRWLLWSHGALSPGCSGGSAGTDCWCHTVEPGHSNADKHKHLCIQPGLALRAFPSAAAAVAPLARRSCGSHLTSSRRGAAALSSFLLLSPFLQYELF